MNESPDLLRPWLDADFGELLLPIIPYDADPEQFSHPGKMPGLFKRDGECWTKLSDWQFGVKRLSTVETAVAHGGAPRECHVFIKEHIHVRGDNHAVSLVVLRSVTVVPMTY